MNRGYIDFARLFEITTGQAFFVTRAKGNTQFRRIYSHPAEIHQGILSDQTIRLSGPKTSNLYPANLRRVHFYDAEYRRHLYFLTNDFSQPAITIARLYKCRWAVELFFKWIKQHLRFKAFYGLSANAVKTQVWIALCVYVLIAIIKKKLGIQASLYTILQVISTSAFEKSPLIEAFREDSDHESDCPSAIQLNLFDL